MDLYRYIVCLQQEVHRVLVLQNNRMNELANELAAVRAQLERLERLPRMNIEKIEYSFEQLKVERLDGTLIIGISPFDTGTIQDLQVQQQHQEDVTFGQTNAPEDPERPIRKDVGDYIRRHVPELLAKEAQARGLELLPEHRELIVEDMLKQIDERIGAYYRFMQGDKNTNKDGQTVADLVFQKVKQDVHAALERYVEHFGKGDGH
ncbi:MAG TPA: spore germination protein GerPC [Paenibacillus sp.]|uniref:spore germination protein GerPC n=1 Tax=Paenibacillus sp. TaxID=58172 RepID=UPI0028D6F13F|nr:spore germination protein GerPC [Paenibacillus sp.]HUC92751.1 spore germination protein GerPC [Paenibacillus sp.]